jgi:hypothetical protein
MANNPSYRPQAGPKSLTIIVEFDVEEDGRHIAAVNLPGVTGVEAYGKTRDEARRRVLALALHVLADRLEAGELDEMPAVTFDAA